ncbi:hypothetical protein WDW37_16945 [Bdellovibrionota bacterium FG-1]
METAKRSLFSWSWTRACILTLLLGLGLRLSTALLHLDIVHPDEHFQTLEPAAHAVYGFGWMAWEWQAGTRSWLIPGLYMPLLYFFKLLGIQGGPLTIQACRVLMALASAWTLVRFWALLKRAGLSLFGEWVGLAIFSLSPAMVAWGATTLSDNWALIFLWGAMPSLWDLMQKPRARSWIFAGILLGFSFLARIQTVSWAFAVGLVVFFWMPSKRRFLGWAILGYSFVILFQGILDLFTWGQFLHSPIANIQKNWVEKVQVIFGVSPWYSYFRMVPDNLGYFLCLSILMALGLLGVVTLRDRLRGRISIESPLPAPGFWPFILLPAGGFLLFHILMPHKETRFLLPIYPVGFLVIAWGLDFLLTRASISFRYANKIALVLTVIGSFFSATHVYTSDHYYLFDLAELAQRMYAEVEKTQTPTPCLLLVDHYWAWTHGELMQGRPFRYVEVSSFKKIPPISRATCGYAMMTAAAEARFVAQAGPQWVLLARDSEGKPLYKNSGINK